MLAVMYDFCPSLFVLIISYFFCFHSRVVGFRLVAADEGPWRLTATANDVNGSINNIDISYLELIPSRPLSHVTGL